MESLKEGTENNNSENQKISKSEFHTAQKQPYQPPNAIFVPLKLEERLFGSGGSPICGFNPNKC